MHPLVSFLGPRVRSKPLLSVLMLWVVRTRLSFAAGLPETTSPTSDLQIEVGESRCARTPSCGAGHGGASGKSLVLARARLPASPAARLRVLLPLSGPPAARPRVLLPCSGPPAPHTPTEPGARTQAWKLWAPTPAPWVPLPLLAPQLCLLNSHRLLSHATNRFFTVCFKHMPAASHPRVTSLLPTGKVGVRTPVPKCKQEQ